MLYNQCIIKALYSGLLKIRTPKNPDFCVFAKQGLSKIVIPMGIAHIIWVKSHESYLILTFRSSAS